MGRKSSGKSPGAQYVSHLSVFPKTLELGCGHLRPWAEENPRETDTACGRDRSYKADGKARRASPRQSDIVIVIFAPLPALSRVHSKVQRQQLMLWICKWDHSWGGNTHTIKESSWGKMKATEHRLTPGKRLLNHTKGLLTVVTSQFLMMNCLSRKK